MGPAGLIRRIGQLPRPLLVALDVDGTLAPIVDDPAAASVPAQTRRALRSLVSQRGVRVAFVTGRDASSLGRILPVKGAWRALEHGRRIVAPGRSAGRVAVAPADRARLRAFESWARREAVPAGARLERKPGSRALHTRELQRDHRRQAEAWLDRARREARHLGLHVRDGRAVVEVELCAGDKGEALVAIRRASRARGVFYAGDDLTDLPAIREAVASGGVASSCGRWSGLVHPAGDGLGAWAGGYRGVVGGVGRRGRARVATARDRRRVGRWRSRRAGPARRPTTR